MVYRQQDIKCNLCGSEKYEILYNEVQDRRRRAELLKEGYRVSETEVRKPVKVAKCLKCGLIYLSSVTDTRKYLKKYIEMVDKEYVKEEEGRRLSANYLLDKIAQYKKRGRLLDIGCATGFLLDEARSRGLEVHGIELSKWAVKYAKERLNLNVFKGTLSKAKFPSTHFDVIVMADLLEHLPQPKETLLEVRRILKDDGILYISTPDISSFLSQFLEAQWWGINAYHLFYFSKKTLNDLLYTTGFKTIKYASHFRAFSIIYWAERIRPYSKWLHGILDFISRIGNLRSFILKIGLNDQIAAYVTKLKRLDFLVDRLEEKKSKVRGKIKTIVVLPAYNAEKTLERTVKDIPEDVIDDIILVDDVSKDGTVKVARKLGLKVFVHDKNIGYGGNQKTCYQKALEMGADIVVMVHPDYQYDPTIIPKLIEPIKRGEADAVFGSRMMKGGALEGGMPLWKHNVNILLTAFENVMMGTYLTEFHSGFRAYSAKTLKTINFMANSDNFVFDTEIIAQLVVHNFKIDEIPIRCRYFEEASSIKFWPSVVYGLSIIWTMLKYMIHTKEIFHFKQLE